jgi:hypothetical protein
VFYVEYAPDTNVRHGNMLPEAVVNAMTGFRSVFSFAASEADKIRATGASKGFKLLPSVCNTWFIDIDRKDIPVPELMGRLDALDASYEVYQTPSKGYHLHVDLATIAGKDVPYTIRMLTAHYFPEADLSVCKASSLIRLPNTPGKKGGVKTLIEKRERGTLLEVGLRVQPEAVERFDIRPIDASDEMKFFFSDLAYRCGKSPGCGKRNETLWLLAKTANELGVSKTCAGELLSVINASWPDAHDEAEVTRALDGGYR